MYGTVSLTNTAQDFRPPLSDLRFAGKRLRSTFASLRLSVVVMEGRDIIVSNVGEICDRVRGLDLATSQSGTFRGCFLSAGKLSVSES